MYDREVTKLDRIYFHHPHYNLQSTGVLFIGVQPTKHYTGMQPTQPYRHGTCCFASVAMPHTLYSYGALFFFEFLLISLVAFASHEYSNYPFTRCPFTHSHSHSTHSSYRYYSPSSINLASQRHQHSSWARVTKSKPKRERGRLLARASTRNSKVLMQ